jgi:hypothetical protein
LTDKPQLACKGGMMLFFILFIIEESGGIYYVFIIEAGVSNRGRWL